MLGILSQDEHGETGCKARDYRQSREQWSNVPRVAVLFLPPFEEKPCGKGYWRLGSTRIWQLPELDQLHIERGCSSVEERTRRTARHGLGSAAGA
jgi:hypothetical protein